VYVTVHLPKELLNYDLEMYLEGLRKDTPSVRIVSVLAQISTDDLPNTIQRRYRLIKLVWYYPEDEASMFLWKVGVTS
jgi:hypothetical protein